MLGAALSVQTLRQWRCSWPQRSTVGAPAIPVTPTTPTAFETRRVGMILDVEPQISEDGKTIDLLVTPDLTEFLGFVNYGSPINQVSGNFQIMS
jgi:hypothetical protein